VCVEQALFLFIWTIIITTLTYLDCSEIQQYNSKAHCSNSQ